MCSCSDTDIDPQNHGYQLKGERVKINKGYPSKSQRKLRKSDKKDTKEKKRKQEIILCGVTCRRLFIKVDDRM